MPDHKNIFPYDDYKTVLNSLKISEEKTSPQVLFGLVDLTSLNITDSNRSIGELVNKVNRFSGEFYQMPSVAGICVFPRFVSLVRKQLKAGEVKVVSVAASFPFAQAATRIKAEEVKRAAGEGADEIDIVISVGEILEGNTAFVMDELTLLKKACGNAHMKVILETGVLGDPELIYNTSLLALNAGADFIKTSTGKSSVSATPEAAVSMCLALRDFMRSTGLSRGFKPAGGISTPDDAALYSSIVLSILGAEWLVPGHFRIGASRLANRLLSISLGKEIKYFS